MKPMWLISFLLFSLLLVVSTQAQPFGDTLHVGTTWVDQQHPASFSTMLAINEQAEEHEAKLTAVYTRQNGPGTLPSVVMRAYKWLDAHIYQLPTYEVDPSLSWSSNPAVAIVSDRRPVIVLNGFRTDPEEQFLSMLYTRGFCPNNLFQHPMSGTDDPAIAPRIVAAEYQGTEYIHALLYEAGFDTMEYGSLYYVRGEYDPVTGAVFDATPGGEGRLLVTDLATNPSATIAVNPSYNHVAIAQTISRYLNPEYHEGDGVDPHNTDIFIWESEDAGETWSFGLDGGDNITAFLPANPDILPDTMSANQDSLRVYADIDMAYDRDSSKLYTVFTVNGFHFFQQEIALQSRLFFHMKIADNADTYTQIAEAYFPIFAETADWEPIITNPRLFVDEVEYWGDNYVWCSWVQYGEPGEYTLDHEPLDASDDGYKATEVFLSFSPFEGQWWVPAANVTESKNLNTGLQPYESQSERELSMTALPDDDCIHLFYTVDQDPGVAMPSDDPQGDATVNTLVYNRIEKMEIIDLYATGWSWWDFHDWVDNYPLHFDSSGYYEWHPSSVDDLDRGANLPDGMVLERVYPNPFNGTARIEFTLPAPDRVAVSVVDLLGREVVRLADHDYTAGTHALTFDGSDFASGVYFVRAGSTRYGERVEKVVLLK